MLKEVLENGFAFADLTPGETAAVAAVLGGARGFFARKMEMLEGRPWLRPVVVNGVQSFHSGFHAMGEEYGQDPTRPDIMESFAVLGTEFTEEQMAWLCAEPYVARLLEVKAAVERRAAAAFAAVYDGDLGFGAYTTVQVSYYRTSEYRPRPGDTPLEKREYLLDPHEDGHFLTWLCADKWGLVGRPGESGPWVWIPPANDKLLVFPSAPFCYWAGGGLPYYHGVRRTFNGAAVDDRVSLVIFLNPDVRKDIRPLRVTPENDGILFGTLLNEGQLRFGVPRYASGLPGNAKTAALVDKLYG